MSQFGSRMSGFFGGATSGGGGGTGTVTSVCAVSCSPTSLCVIGSSNPITNAGTFCFCNLQPYTGQAVEVLGAGTLSTVRCGVGNSASGNYSASLGGCLNCATGNFSFVGGGCSNCALTTYGTILGGNTNKICTEGYNFIGSGSTNTNCSKYGGLVSGSGNSLAGQSNFIGSGQANQTTSSYSSIVGGNLNCILRVGCDFNFIGGGCTNFIDGGCYSAILGGKSNNLSGNDIFIIGSNLTSTQNCTTFVNCLSADNLATGNAVCVGVNKTLVSYVPSGGAEIIINSAGNCSVERCGVSNCACGGYSSSLSGQYNLVNSGDYSSIVGGKGNCTQSSTYSFIGGGLNNIINGSNNSEYFAILGGKNNKIESITDSNGFIGFGQDNIICGGTGVGQGLVCRSSILGGQGNCLFNSYASLIGVGDFNTISTYGQTCQNAILSGCSNVICCSATLSFIGGGVSNTISCNKSAILGGCLNTISSPYSTISGGYSNTINESFSFIGGGKANTSSGQYSTILGGITNTITSFGNCSSILGGSTNLVCDAFSTIIGGENNVIKKLSTYSTISGQSNDSGAFNNVHIFGCSIIADRDCTTFVNNLSIMNIPTSSGGLPSGAVWNDSGTLKIV